MAVGFLRRQWQQMHNGLAIEFLSTGIYAVEGEPAHPLAVSVLHEEYDIDISDHFSRAMTDGMLHAADLILAMGEGHRQSVFYRVPSALSKTLLISELANEYEDIADPYGSARAVYVATAEKLHRLIAAGWPKLLEILGLSDAGTESDAVTESDAGTESDTGTEEARR